MTSETTSCIGPDKVMDVRVIPCSVKHGLILRTWAELPVGDHFVLLNGHDPLPLYRQFTAADPSVCGWEYLERGPENYRIKITKLKELPDGCAPAPVGGCHGAH